MRRDKRCLLAYHRTRTDKLEELVWNGADVLDLSGQQVRDTSAAANGASAGAGETSTSSLSPQEEEYVRQYGDLLAAYKGQWTDVDLTGSLGASSRPFHRRPGSQRRRRDTNGIRVCVLLLISWIASHKKHRAITLTKNSQFYVRQGDVERLIAQGYLQKLG